MAPLSDNRHDRRAVVARFVEVCALVREQADDFDAIVLRGHERDFGVVLLGGHGAYCGPDFRHGARLPRRGL